MVIGMADWNSAQYLKFERQRTQPSADLAKRIGLTDPKRILDIGCGPGNSTALLKRFFPDAEVVGADNSENMLEKARASHPDLSFVRCDAETELGTLGGGYDVVFSNACIQWIPDHHKLIGEMFSLLGRGGVLAVQLPMSDGEPLFQIIREVAAEPRWGLGSMQLRTLSILSPAEYFDILSGLTEEFELWETAYYHRMPSHQALIEWVKGTRLRPYLSALSPAEAAEFEGELLRRASKVYPVQPNGEILFRFNRFFFTAVK